MLDVTLSRLHTVHEYEKQTDRRTEVRHHYSACLKPIICIVKKSMKNRETDRQTDKPVTALPRLYKTRTPPVEAHRPVTYLQFAIQVCFFVDHAQSATPSVTDNFRHRQPYGLNSSIDSSRRNKSGRVLIGIRFRPIRNF